MCCKAGEQLGRADQRRWAARTSGGVGSLFAASSPVAQRRNSSRGGTYRIAERLPRRRRYRHSQYRQSRFGPAPQKPHTGRPTGTSSSSAISPTTDYKTGQPFPPGSPPPSAVDLRTLNPQRDRHCALDLFAARRPVVRLRHQRLLDEDGDRQTKIDGTGTSVVSRRLQSATSRNFTIKTERHRCATTRRASTPEPFAPRPQLSAATASATRSIRRASARSFTPSGERTVSGSFVQLKTDYAGRAGDDHRRPLRQVFAVRAADSTTTATTCRRRAPSGFTAIPGFTPYVTYAEGYRAPALTETLRRRNPSVDRRFHPAAESGPAARGRQEQGVRRQSSLQ